MTARPFPERDLLRLLTNLRAEVAERRRIDGKREPDDYWESAALIGVLRGSIALTLRQLAN